MFQGTVCVVHSNMDTATNNLLEDSVMSLPFLFLSSYQNDMARCQKKVACLTGSRLVASGKADRVVFKLNVELEKLEARLQYESSSAPPLALVSVEEVAVDLTVHPDTLKATASLGNLRAQDGILPEVGTAVL